MSDPDRPIVVGGRGCAPFGPAEGGASAPVVARECDCKTISTSVQTRVQRQGSAAAVLIPRALPWSSSAPTTTAAAAGTPDQSPELDCCPTELGRHPPALASELPDTRADGACEALPPASCGPAPPPAASGTSNPSLAVPPVLASDSRASSPAAAWGVCRRPLSDVRPRGSAGVGSVAASCVGSSAQAFPGKAR